MNNSTYLAVSEQLFATSADDSNCPTKRENNAPVLSWPSSVINNNNEPVNLMSVVDPTEFDMSNLIWQVNNTDSPPSTQSSSNDLSNSLISYFDNLFEPWNNNNIQVPATIKEEWENINNPVKQEPQEFTLSYPEQQQPFKLPLTPPFDTNNSNNNRLRNSFGFTAEPMPISSTATDFNELYSNTILQQVSREITPPTSATVSSFASSSNSPLSNVSTPPPPAMAHQYLPQQYLINHLSSTPTKSRGAAAARRKSADGHSAPTRTYRRRASSHPSVASVVSLSAHEPVSRIIGGIEHITFLYSHDRLVKEYTVRTDIDSVNLDDIPLDFRVPNAIYPRANVSKEHYDGNRWEYETSCNRLGWELCWLNQERLCGRRGLIQRAVDSYRNRHAELRSRRVTRQEKVANGTLRKRRAKKAHPAIL